MRTRIAIVLTAATFTMGAGAAIAATAVVNHNITEVEVQQAQQAQQAWGEALIAISAAYTEGGHEQAKQKAQEVLDAAYGYVQGAVLFKPTLASGEQTFRTNYEGALSYFVGGNPIYADDSGFALKGWESYDFRNAGVYINGDIALTMGHVILTDAEGQVTTVDKTWGFRKGDDGELRIVLHHSSLPFSAD